MDYSIIEKLKPNYLNKSEIVDNILIVKNQKCKVNRNFFKFSFLKNLLKSNNLSSIKRNIFKKIEWKEDLKILIISVKKGRDLECFPEDFNLKKLDIVALDKSIKNLFFVNDKYGEKFSLSLMKCCADTLPFIDETFDIVLFIDGIYEYIDKKKIVKEILRISKNGAKIIISDRYTLENEDEIESLHSEILKYVYECNLSYFDKKRYFCMEFIKD